MLANVCEVKRSTHGAGQKIHCKTEGETKPSKTFHGPKKTFLELREKALNSEHSRNLRI
jgi:hypothetical protein